MILDDRSTVLGNLVPVNDIPPGANVFRSTILVFQVIGMLPYIQTKDWKFDFVTNTLHERIVLVWSSCVANIVEEERVRERNYSSQKSIY